MASIVIRSIIIYVLLMFSLRIMGKRQIGELDVGDLVSTLLISELAAIPIDDPDIPLLNMIIPTFLILSLEIIISSVKNKSEKLKKIVEGEPTYIIYKGRLLQQTLAENRISINELLAETRSQGISDIGEISYAILEQDGKLSLIKSSDTPLSHPIVIDGEIKKDSLTRLGYNEEWIKKVLDKKSIKISDILLMTVNDSGNISIVKKDGSF